MFIVTVCPEGGEEALGHRTGTSGMKRRGIWFPEELRFPLKIVLGQDICILDR